MAITASLAAPLPEVAYYYPNATWRIGSSDFIKNLVLYFDGVGLLVPEYIRDKPFAQDPELASALWDHGLLHILTPETVVTKDVSENLAASVTDILSTGALDHLSADGSAFQELSYSRLGYYGDPGLAEMLFEEFKRRGLVRQSVDGESIPMHPIARSMVLVLLAQILRANSRPLGLNLSPATDRPDVLNALAELLSVPELPTAGQVVSSDLKQVGVDLSGVPIRQVLEFRRTYGDELQRYAREVREFSRRLSVLPEVERADSYRDRAAELDAMAREVARRASSYWKQPTAFYLSVLSATAALGGNNLMSALFAVGGAFAASGPTTGSDGGAYSYLFKARRIHS